MIRLMLKYRIGPRQARKLKRMLRDAHAWGLR